MYCCMGDMIYQRGQCVLLYGRCINVHNVHYCMGDVIYQCGQCVLLYRRYDISVWTVCTVV